MQAQAAVSNGSLLAHNETSGGYNGGSRHRLRGGSPVVHPSGEVPGCAARKLSFGISEPVCAGLWPPPAVS